MTIYKIKKTENFVILDRTFLYDEALSWQAKGILALLLSRPANWEVHVSELVKRSANGEHSTRSALNELKKRGYIVFLRNRQSGQFSSSCYYVFEQPQLQSEIFEDNFSPPVSSVDLPENPGLQEKSPHPDFPHVENPDVGNPNGVFPHPKNHGLLSNNITKQNIHKEKRAAEKMPVENFSQHSAASALSSLKEEDYVINKSLTAFQCEKVQSLVQQYQVFFPDWSSTYLFDELVFEILDDSFTQCGRDFFKKLNVLKKAIREGQWQRSRRGIKNHEAKQTSAQQAQATLSARLVDVQLQLNSVLNELEQVQKYEWPGEEALREKAKQLHVEQKALKQQLGLE